MMIDQGWLILAIFIGTIAGLLRYQTKTATVFGITMLLLFGTGLVSEAQLLSSITNPGLITLLLLIVTSKALEKTRLLRILASKVIVKSYSSTWLRLFGITSLTSGILNNTAVVATLMAPVCNNPHHSPSKLLLPLSYAAILGGTLTLIGTSTNLIVNSLLIDSHQQSLSFFSFTAIGILVVCCCGLVLRLVSRWLPEHPKPQTPESEYFIEANIQAGSQLIGQSVEDNGLRHMESLFLVEIIRQERLISPVTPAEILQKGDRLIFCGDISKVFQVNQFHGLALFAKDNHLLDSNLTEVVIRPESILAGNTLKKAGFRALFDAAVVAIRRDGEQLSGKLGDITLQVGDFLVLAAGKDFSSRHNLSKNFILLSGLEPEAPLKGHQETLALAGFGLAIALAATGVLALLKGMVLLLGILILTRCLTVNEILRRLPIDIWLIVASALLLSQGLNNSGLLDHLGELFHIVQGPEHAYLALILIYVLTWLLTELITNNASAALVFPIAYGIANSLGVDILPFVMAVAFGASASFLSPYGYQTNLMIYNAGQYKLKDFIKIGFPVSLTYSAVVLIAIPIFFPLS